MHLRHYDHDGRARFVTFCTHKRIPLLTNNTFRKAVLGTIRFVGSEFKLRLLGYVLMPEHVHLVLVPPEEVRLGGAVGEIKRQSALWIHDLLQKQGGMLMDQMTIIRDGVPRFVLWQRRCYDHNCHTEKDVWEKVNYCHNNPVKRGLVKSPERWEWSSYRYYADGTNALLEINLSEET
jgi:putative transposase